MSKRLDGRVAIITGASRGLGRAFAVAFASEGASVVAVDVLDSVDTCKAVRQAGGEAIAIKADISSEKATQNMAAETLRAFGKIDILVNNAGIYRMIPFAELTLADWQKTLAVNLEGAFLCTKAVVPHMREKKYGRIINIASGQALVGLPGYAHYSASKAGLVALTRCTSSELGDDGINVNCICPGLTETEGLVNLAPPAVVEASINMVVSMQSIKRREVAQDLVGAAIFFASKDSDFISGQTLCVDGGAIKH